MKVSEHFSLVELTRSDTARMMGDPNMPSSEHLENLKTRLAPFLEKVRTLVGDRPIFIESGYRNPRVNAHVGGVPNSEHALGLAADIQVAGMSDLDVAIAIRDSDLQFNQLILERGRTVHVSVGPAMRRQVLRQPGGPGTAVYEGLEA